MTPEPERGHVLPTDEVQWVWVTVTRVCLSVSVLTWKMGTLTEPASQGSLQD